VYGTAATETIVAHVKQAFTGLHSTGNRCVSGFRAKFFAGMRGIEKLDRKNPGIQY
jgi:hypothetical protein